MPRSRRQRVLSPESSPERSSPVRHARVSHPILIKPREFDSKLETFKKWLYHFKNASRANGWDFKRQLDVLPAYFPEGDQEFFEQLPSDATIEDIFDHFATKYDESGEADMAWVSLQTRTQRTDESVQEFSIALDALVQTAHPELGENGRKKIAKNHFIHQCLPPIRKAILNKSIDEPLDYERAFRCAKQAEANEKLLASVCDADTGFSLAHVSKNSDEELGAKLDSVLEALTSNSASCTSVAASTVKTNTNDLNERFIELELQMSKAVTSFSQAISNLSSDLKRARPQSAIKCFKCQKLGHTANKCRSGPQGQRLQCFKCQKFGHKASECRSSELNTFKKSHYQNQSN